MNYYILSIDSLVTTFQLIESSNPILFKLQSSSKAAELFEEIKEKDVIFGYYVKPTEGVLLIMEVEEINDDSVILRKLFEFYGVIDIKTIVSNYSYTRLQIPSTLEKISIKEVNEIKKQFYLQTKDIIENIIEVEESDIDMLKDEGEEYIGKKNSNDYIQKIYFGAPGTGKSYKAKEEIAKNQLSDKDINSTYKELIEKGLIEDSILNSEYIYRTTIYPEFSYHDFIGHVMPIVKKDKDEDVITYEFKPGIFTMALEKALMNNNKRIYLIIEEMSRGNIASVFGDIFQLLDRDKNGDSEYQIDNNIIYKYFEDNADDESWKEILNEKGKIRLPNNFNIIGTINTSDQNVFVMDNAFKRRFEFEYVNIKPIKNDKHEYLNNFSIEFKDGSIFEWIYLYQALNKYIVSKDGLDMPEDKQIGQFFIKFTKDEEKNYNQITNKLLLYLWEDIHLVNMSDIKSMFKYDSHTKYDSFANIYEDLCNEKNIFNDEIIDIYIDIKSKAETEDKD